MSGFWCWIGFHMNGFIRSWWDGNTLNSLYRCRDCGRFSTKKLRT